MALLFTVLLGLSAGILGYFSYYFNRGHFVAGAEALIATEMKYLAEADSNGQLAKTLQLLPAGEGRVYLLLAPDGQKIWGTLPALPENVSVLSEGTLLFSPPGTAQTYAARIYTFANGRRLLVGTDVTNGAAAYRTLQWLSLLSIVLMTLVVFTSFLISTFVVSRTNRIALTAQDIMETGDLTRRIAVDSRWDDLSNMAFVLNGLLGRIEQLVQGVKQVSDNIAHDLRTPLTRLLNNLETLRAQSDEEAQKACDAMIAEADGLLQTFNALLRIARIEMGRQKSHFDSVALDQLMIDVIDLYEPLAEAKNIIIKQTLKPVVFHGDRDLLFQIFANLLDNAVKFSAESGLISLSLESDDKHITAAVIDNGPGVSNADKDKIFDRFYRAEQSRSTPGSGLGLSLVSAAVTLHGGIIRLEDTYPGLKILVILPATGKVT